jgi:hypothetical protein
MKRQVKDRITMADRDMLVMSEIIDNENLAGAGAR